MTLPPGPGFRLRMWLQRRLVDLADAVLLLAVCLLAGACGESQETTSAAGPESVYGWWDLVDLDGAAAQDGPGGPPSLFVGVSPALNEAEQADGLLFMNGSSGCNGFSGAYRLVDGRFEALSMLSTAMGCGDALNNQAAVFGRVLSGAQIRVEDDQLLMVADDGTEATFVSSVSEVGDGVYRLDTVDGRSADDSVTMRVRGDTFSSYVGCFVDGPVSRTDAVLVFGAPTSLSSATTLSPPRDGSAPEVSEPVGPLFGCEGVGQDGAVVLEVLTAGEAVVQADGLTITGASGNVVEFRRV